MIACNWFHRFHRVCIHDSACHGIRPFIIIIIIILNKYWSMIAMLSSRCHDSVCPGICPFIIMIISDILFSLVLVFISSDRSLASEMLSSRCHDSACRGIHLSLNCIPATRQTIVTTGHQPHTIPRADIPQMHNTTCTKYLLSHQPHMWNRVNASQISMCQPSLVRPCAARSGLIPTVTLQQASLSISCRSLTGL